MKLVVFKESGFGVILDSLLLDYKMFYDEETLLNSLEKKDVVFIKDNMELVRKISKMEGINIIYNSDDIYDCPRAFSYHVSGYLLGKVTKEDIQNELKHLRYGEWNKPYVRCFGNFDLLLQGKSVTFPRRKSQDVLAYLVYRRGELVSVEELQEVIFGEKLEKNRKYIYVLKFECAKILEANGISSILEVVGNKFRINTEAFDCDYYQYLDGDTHLYKGEFMHQFAWAKDLI